MIDTKYRKPDCFIYKSLKYLEWFFTLLYLFIILRLILTIIFIINEILIFKISIQVIISFKFALHFIRKTGILLTSTKMKKYFSFLNLKVIVSKVKSQSKGEE